MSRDAKPFIFDEVVDNVTSLYQIETIHNFRMRGIGTFTICLCDLYIKTEACKKLTNHWLICQICETFLFSGTT